LVAGAVLLQAAAARAESDEATPDKETKTRDTRRDVPVSAYTYSSQGAVKGSTGGQGMALGLVAPDQKAALGGGATVWGAPLERLTLIGDAQRNVWGNFSPSIAAVVPLLGERNHGWSLGGLGKFKIDGFASGPNKDEIESELEIGALLAFADSGFRFDLNLIGGRGLGDDGETDAEARLRLGSELGRYFWLGLDGQGRVRASGPRYLPNGQIWDFAAGPQFLVGSRSFFASLTGGPATMGLLSSKLGFTSVLCLGGTT
jgi:hypothetical protein